MDAGGISRVTRPVNRARARDEPGTPRHALRLGRVCRPACGDGRVHRLVHVDASSVAPLAGLPRLERLTLKGCTRLTDLTGLGDLPKLTNLVISDCPALTDLSGLHPSSPWAKPSLQVLRLAGTAVPPAQVLELRRRLPQAIIQA